MVCVMEPPSFIGEEDEEEAVRMANGFLGLMYSEISADPTIPAFALGYALAVLMSRTNHPEATFSAALDARTCQYEELVAMGEAPRIFEH